MSKIDELAAKMILLEKEIETLKNKVEMQEKTGIKIASDIQMLSTQLQSFKKDMFTLITQNIDVINSNNEKFFRIIKILLGCLVALFGFKEFIQF